MAILGLTNPWIIGAYIGCFATTIICCIIGLKAKNLGSDDEGDE